MACFEISLWDRFVSPTHDQLTKVWVQKRASLTARDGYRFFSFFPDIGAKPVLKKNNHKTTIDNDDIKNVFGHIPWKSRTHGRTDTNSEKTNIRLSSS